MCYYCYYTVAAVAAAMTVFAVILVMMMKTMTMIISILVIRSVILHVFVRPFARMLCLTVYSEIIFPVSTELKSLTFMKTGMIKDN